ncbi:hypothetical protein Aperf_G00000099210 [Anoplocephala perfoliata]
MSGPSSSQRSVLAAGNAMAQRFLKADRRVASCLLAIIPATLEKQSVRITLLDDTVVTGELDQVDGFGNMVLVGGVTITPPASRKKAVPVTNFEILNISGKRIRYVDLPEDVDVQASIAKYLEGLKARHPLNAPSKPKKKRQLPPKSRGVKMTRLR